MVLMKIFGDDNGIRISKTKEGTDLSEDGLQSRKYMHVIVSGFLIIGYSKIEG